MKMTLPKPVKREPTAAASIIETVLSKGDLSQLSVDERNAYYFKVCESVGLNPLTRPLEYIMLGGKTVLYAKKDATDQLRSIHNVSVEDMQESEVGGVYIVTVKVRNGNGRTDMGKGAVNIKNLQGEPLANALMKAETKAKRRATLSICGLGMLDETEAEDVQAQEKGKTLAKKDAKDVYTKLQHEMREQQTLDELNAWVEISKPRIEIMPYDWQDTLRNQYSERRLEFRQKMLEEAGAEYDQDTGELK
jgi:hypothetical protein